MAAKGYLEHTALYVKDLEWHVIFFKAALGMTVKQERPTAAGTWQVWLDGGLQLIHDPEYNAGEGRLAHLGIMTDNLDRAIETATANGASILSTNKNWMKLPEGVIIELMQATPDARRYAPDTDK